MWPILDFFFPKRCVSCGRLGNYLCSTCLKGIHFVGEEICPVCERAAIGGATHPGCQTKYSLDGLTSICVYDGPIKKAIKRLKYRPWMTDLGETLARLIFTHLQENISVNQFLNTKPTLVPVPLHSSRERQRGFNQSALLGKLVAREFNLGFIPNFLIRTKQTRPQVELKGKDRLENIRDAFDVNRQSAISLQPSAILLIDDVWTTGATLRACTNVLKRAGASKVWALTLAR